MVLKDGDAGLSAISLVGKPAIETNFVKLKAEKAAIKMQFDDDKQIITGPVLIPDQEIYRNSNFGLGECTIQFSAKTIEQAAAAYLASNNTMVTLQHQEDTDKVKLVESWLIADSKVDKAVTLGYDLPVGTWMASHHVEDIDLWEQIKSGEMNGYSIEAMFDSVQLSEENPMTDEAIDKLADDLVSMIK